jgi:hypothetical protein
MRSPLELRSLAAWYREFAKRAGKPAIWEARLKTAEDLEREAGQIEDRIALPAECSGTPG